MNKHLIRPVYLQDDQIQNLLSWDTVYDAVEKALVSVIKHDNADGAANNEQFPISCQPPRAHTYLPDKSGLLLTMPAFIGNYGISSMRKHNDNKLSTLSCKVVTIFDNATKHEMQLAPVQATILLFDTVTGKVKCIMEGNEITAWRTCAASLVATKHLYLHRCTNDDDDDDNKVLAILGCGVQGRIHAIGMCTMFKISKIQLWNRTAIKSHVLSKDLEKLRDQFKNCNLEIIVANDIDHCVQNADIIVTATFANSPFLYKTMLKENVHINVVSAGLYAHAELDAEIYRISQIYVDSFDNSNHELKTLQFPIIGEIGQIITNRLSRPKSGVTIFHSMGMAVEDATVAEIVYQKYLSKIECNDSEVL